MIYREIKDLTSIVSVDVVHPDMLKNGWTFSTDFEGTTGDTIHGFNYLYEVYQAANPNGSAGVTVPVLWDKKTRTIVNNESADIIRIFNVAFNDLTGNTMNLYPDHLQHDINQINQRIYSSVNNGVYKARFSTTQHAYNTAVQPLFQELTQLNEHLASTNYLVGNQLTEADIRLIPTLIRFDCVYHTQFKCNQRMIREYPNLHRYLHRLFEHPAINQTTYVDHVTRHYYYSHTMINPHQIIPILPDPLL